MLYGYLYYPLYALASEQLYRVLDTALTHKCEEVDAPPGVDRFQRRLDWLLSQGVLRAGDKRAWEALCKLRNLGSHPEDRTLMPPGLATLSLEQTATVINAMFDPGVSVVDFPYSKPPGSRIPDSLDL